MHKGHTYNLSTNHITIVQNGKLLYVHVHVHYPPVVIRQKICSNCYKYGKIGRVQSPAFTAQSIDKLRIWRMGLKTWILPADYPCSLQETTPTCLCYHGRAGRQKTDSGCRAGQSAIISTLKKAEFLIPTARSLAVQTLGVRLLEKDATFTRALTSFLVTC